MIARSVMLRRTAVAYFAMTLLALTPLAAQDQDEEFLAVHEGYEETVDVSVVNVEVVVTDEKGQPVTGLSRHDFAIFEDGRKIELTNFFAARGDTSASASTMVDESMAQDPDEIIIGPSSRSAPTPTADTQTLKLVIFVDHLNIEAQNRKRLFDQLREHLRSVLEPGSEVMVASLGSELEIPVQFTQDVEQVFAALAKEEGKTSFHTVFEGEKRTFLSQLRRASVREFTPARSVKLSDPDTGEIRRVDSEGDPNFDGAVRTAMELAIGARTLAEAKTQRVRGTLEALGIFCDRLGEIPGRKALLYLSDGLPTRPAEVFLQAWTSKFETWSIQNENDIRQKSRIPEAVSEFRKIVTALGSGQFDLHDEVTRLAARASEQRVAFYPVSPNAANVTVSAGEVGSVTGTGGAARDAQVAETQSREMTLIQLAADTGGVALVGSFNLAGHLQKVQRDFTDFYSLGFTPLPRTGKDSFRKLRIEVLRDGLKVRHVKGYREKEPVAAAAPGEVVVAGHERQVPIPGMEAAVDEIVDVRVVNVEVVVTDKKGQPLTDLTREDFELLRDGQPMELSNFFQMNRGAEGQEVEEAVAVVADTPDVATSTAPAETTRDTNLVIFVDNFNIGLQSRRLLFDNLRQHLVEQEGAQMMVVTMNRQVEVALPFTDDIDLILATLDDIAEKNSFHALAEGTRRMFLSRLERAPLRYYTPPAGGERDLDFEDAVRQALDLSEAVRSLAEERYHKVAHTLEALGGLCGTLGGLSGRKALIYLSDGLPLRPADSLVEAFTTKYQSWLSDNERPMRDWTFFHHAPDALQRVMSSIGSSEFDLHSELNRLTVQANDNQVAFYPISNSGRGASFVSAEDLGSANHDSGSMRRNTQVAENFTRDAALLQLAEDTGGVAMLRSANVGRLLEQVERDFSSFYSLGYSPPGEEDFTFHRLEVKVNRPGARVRHIKGYRTKSWRQRLGEMTTAASLFEVESNPLGIQLATGEVSPEGDAFRVPVTVKIPFQHMRMVHSEKHFNAQLTVLVVYREEDGGKSRTRRFDLPIKIPDSRVLEVLPQVAAYPLELTLPGGVQRVAVGVRDHLGQVESTILYDLDVEGTQSEASESEAVATPAPAGA